MSLLQPARKIGKRFQNPVPTQMGGLGMIFKVLPLYWSNRAETEPKTPLGSFTTDPVTYLRPPVSGLRVTWFGHSSVLLEIDGFRVLMDSVWEQRASPVQWMGPKRFFPPTLPLENLPPLDAVLLSHDHYDHLGAKTIRRLSRAESTRRARWITSLGVGRRLRRFGVPVDRLHELNWTESAVIGPVETGAGSLRLTAWPARHFSGRSTTDRFRTLWSSFVLEGPQHRVFFGADSGPWPGFSEIAARYERFDLTMLEIGAYHPLWAQIHLGPDAAAEAYRQMGGPDRAGRLMPIHWGLFNLALHAWRQPIERLSEIAAQEGWRLCSPEPGKPAEICRDHWPCSDWWKQAGQ